MAILLLANGPMQTTAAFSPVTSGTAIKTLLQVKPSATKVAKIKEWGISFDGFAAALPGRVELIETDVGATVTAFVAADITKLDGDALSCGDVTTNLIVVGTTSSGYTSTSENGSIASVRNLDHPIFLPPTAPFVKQFPLGQEPTIQISKFMRIRVTFGTTVNVYCYVKIEV